MDQEEEKKLPSDIWILVVSYGQMFMST